MKKPSARVAAMLLGALVGCSSNARVEARDVDTDDFATRCKALASIDFSFVPDALTQLSATRSVASTSSSVGYCHVDGYVAPNIGFALRLPAVSWNGKLLEFGCSGKCGSTDHVALCEKILPRGYACIVSDGGHKGTLSDAKWAYHNFRAQIDYMVRASHMAALAGKAVVERFFGSAPWKSYFIGCSAGGTQAMQLAQEFPADFDGIIAGAPALSWTDMHVARLWNNRALVGSDGQAILQQGDLDLLHKTVVEKCDLNDGVKDGLLGDPRRCRFEPAVLSCTSSKVTACLNARQIDAARKIYGGPRAARGMQLIPSAVLPGSERTWLDLFRGPQADPQAVYNLIADSFRYQDFQPNPGPTWKPEDFDFERDYTRLGIAASLEPLNPDLRKFKAAGGKLLAYTGWADAIEGVTRTVDYYETAERVVGGRAETQEFFRLFVVPGMNHCAGGDGAHAIAYLSYLQAWVEEGRAPDHLIGSHPRLESSMDALSDPFGMNISQDSAKIQFTRPIYPYPTQTRYLGVGDSNDARSFGPVGADYASPSKSF